MNERLGVFAMLWALFCIGCLDGYAAAMGPSITRQDLEVLRAVLSDWDEAPESLCLSDRPSGKILVHWSTATADSATQIRADLQGTHDLPPALVWAFIARNRKCIPLPLDLIVDSRIVVTNVQSRAIYSDTYRFPELYPEAKCYVHFCLPAYSDSGRTALVRFEFGPTHHGATCTYLLRKENDRWIVVWKKTAYYA